MATKTSKTKAQDDDNEASAPNLGIYVKQLSKLAGAASDISFEKHKKGTKLTVVGLGSVASCVAPISISNDDFKFTLQIAALEAAFGKGSTAADVRYSNDSLVIKTPRANFEIITKEATSIPTVEAVRDGFTEVALNADFWNMLSNSLNYLKLEKVSSSQPDYRLYVEATEKSVFMCTYDAFQLAFLSKKNTTGVTGSFNVPFNRLLAVIKELPNAAATKLYFGDDTLIVKSGGVAASFATSPLADNDPTGPDAKGKAKAVASMDVGFVSFQANDLEEIVSQVRAVAQDDTKVVFSANSSTATLETTSSFGSSKSKLALATKPSEAIKFALELKFLRNLLSKWKEELNIGIVDNTLILKTPAVTYVTVTSDM